MKDIIEEFSKELNIKRNEFYDLEHSEDLQALRKLRQDCDDIKSKIQATLDKAIIDIHNVPDLRNKYLCIQIDNGSTTWVHVVDRDDWYFRLVNGIRLYIKSSFCIIDEYERSAYVFNEPDDIDISWNSIENLEEVSKEDYIKLINDTFTYDKL